MQTFLPFPDYTQSAAVLDNVRLGKQRLEGIKIIKILLQGRYTTFKQADVGVYNPEHGGVFLNEITISKRTSWYNHPAVKMWKGYELSLTYYVWAIIKEWKKRGFKDNQEPILRELIAKISLTQKEKIDPPWLGDEDFHSSHKRMLFFKAQVHFEKAVERCARFKGGKYERAYLRSQESLNHYRAFKDNSKACEYFWPTKEPKYRKFYPEEQLENYETEY